MRIYIFVQKRDGKQMHLYGTRNMHNSDSSGNCTLLSISNPITLEGHFQFQLLQNIFLHTEVLCSVSWQWLIDLKCCSSTDLSQLPTIVVFTWSYRVYLKTFVLTDHSAAANFICKAGVFCDLL